MVENRMVSFPDVLHSRLRNLGTKLVVWEREQCERSRSQTVLRWYSLGTRLGELMSKVLQVAVAGGTVLVGWAVMKVTTPTKESMMKVSFAQNCGQFQIMPPSLLPDFAKGRGDAASRGGEEKCRVVACY